MSSSKKITMEGESQAHMYNAVWMGYGDKGATGHT